MRPILTTTRIWVFTLLFGSLVYMTFAPAIILIAGLCSLPAAIIFHFALTGVSTQELSEQKLNLGILGIAGIISSVLYMHRDMASSMLVFCIPYFFAFLITLSLGLRVEHLLDTDRSTYDKTRYYVYRIVGLLLGIVFLAFWIRVSIDNIRYMAIEDPSDGVYYNLEAFSVANYLRLIVFTMLVVFIPFRNKHTWTIQTILLIVAIALTLNTDINEHTGQAEFNSYTYDKYGLYVDVGILLTIFLFSNFPTILSACQISPNRQVVSYILGMILNIVVNIAMYKALLDFSGGY